MITVEGYSKNSTIRPEGIAVTFGKDMIQEKGGLLRFIRWFEECMRDEECGFMHKCKNRPKYEDILYVYIIIHNRVYYRCYYGGHSKGKTSGLLLPDSEIMEDIHWSRINLAGPMVKAPHKIRRGGFQGFRYTTKLF